MFIKYGSGITTLLERQQPALQGNKARLQREKSQNTRKVKMGGEWSGELLLQCYL